MKKSNISSLYDNVHFIFVATILFILSLRHFYFVPILFIYIIFIIRKTKLIYSILITIIIISASCIKYIIKFEEKEFYGTVIECDDEKAIVKSKGRKILIYHKNELLIGDYGKFVVEDLNYDTELFDYSNYLLNKNIKKYAKLNSFEYNKNCFVIGKIQNYFINKANKHPSIFNKYINTLIFAYQVDEDLRMQTQKLGISHLLAVSGMHISLLLFFLEFLLKKMFYYEKCIDICLSIFLFFYLFLTNFQITVLRATLMMLFKILFKYKKTLFTQLDILSIVGILLLMINPRSLFLLSFDLSFIVSFTIIIYAKNIKIDSRVIQTYLISFISFLVTIPFVLNTNYEINLLSVLIGPIYVLFFEFILYPATLILFLFPKTFFILNYVYNFFEITIEYFSNINFFIIIFGKINWVFFILYEIILYFLLVSFEIKRGRVLLTIYYILFMLFIYNKEFFNPFYTIKMYDVGQGDSILIKLPHNGGNILIDCYNNIVDHLKKDGVKKIDIVFLSHGHSDHTSAYHSLCDELRVGCTYSSYYDETMILENLKVDYKIKLLRSGNSVSLNNVDINVIGPIKKYKSENSNSLVFQIDIDDFKILFTGDIEHEAEYDLIKKYGNNLKSDILKASHHGSKTSNSLEFINYVDPKYILVSVKKDNIYGFPNNQYLLNMKNVFRTDINKSITIYKRKKTLFIK